MGLSKVGLRQVGITTTVPIEVLMAAGYTLVDLSSLQRR